MKKALLSNAPLSQLVKEKGITTWNDLLAYFRALPYGRTTNRADLSLVLKEEKGTCSSKHACLKAIAEENNLNGVKLILCLFKMSEQNTPGIGHALSDHGLEFIPEAHCYILVDEKRIDITNQESDISSIEKDIIEEIEIQPNQVGVYKVDYHKHFLKEWINKYNWDLSFEEAWAIREQCISNLSRLENNPSN